MTVETEHPPRTDGAGGRRPRRWATLAAVAFVGLVALSTPVLGHGLPGSNATLEGIPSWLYLGSGAVVVLASFLFVGGFVGRDVGAFRYRNRPVDADLSVLASVGRVASVALFVAVVALGLLGPNQIRMNHAPSFLVEVYWWVSYGIFAIVVGDVWPVINPWKTVFEWLGEPGLDREYPSSLGAMPALLVFLAFAWLDMVLLVFGAPFYAGLLALAYGVFMVAGMAVYGKDDWLWNVDAFTRVFDFFGRFAPIRLADDGLELRGYAVGLVEDSVPTREEVLLVVAVLYALSFDGFTETPAYLNVLEAVVPQRVLLNAPLLSNVVFGGSLMLGGFAVFVGAYVLFSELMRRAAGSDRSLDEVMRRFVLTLVPIAIAYHLAHYSLYYALQHELLVAILFNPLPGSGIEPDPDLVSFIGPEHVWVWMVALIVVGHVVAVWVAHHASLEYFRDRSAAIRSQVPMLVLMVFYTVVSLWIVSQPFGG